MGFNWSLDAADDEPSEPSPFQPASIEAETYQAPEASAFDLLGFGTNTRDVAIVEPHLESSFVVDPEPLEPVAQPAVSAPAPLSRRELRMAAIAKPPAASSVVSPPRAQSFSSPEISSPESRRRAALSARLTATRPPKKSFRRRALPKLLSLGAMIGAGAFLVATTVPANALMSTNADSVTQISAKVQTQSLAEVNAKAVALTSTRDKYTVLTLAEQYALKYASTDWAYTNDPNGTIQWPFPVQVPIATGFGPRQVAGCSFCSTFHEGVDFDPGQGAAIGAIADGVVTEVVNSHAGLGNHVVISHVINGQKIDSVYAHMLDNSILVTVGQQVKVAQEVGEVGSTGESTGAHLHLEIHLNNVPIDPFAWLKANAN